MSIYYIISNLANGESEHANSPAWPKIIAVSVDEKKILISEGTGHGLSGVTMPIIDFDIDDWGDIFESTNSEWFYDFIRDNGSEFNARTLENEIVKHRDIEIKKF